MEIDVIHPDAEIANQSGLEINIYCVDKMNDRMDFFEQMREKEAMGNGSELGLLSCALSDKIKRGVAKSSAQGEGRVRVHRNGLRVVREVIHTLH